MFEPYRTYNAWTHAETGERVYHVKDYPEIGDAFDCHPRGSVPDYCWGDYVITENRVLLSAYCYIKADGHLIYGSYTLFVLAPSRQWYLRATGLASGTSLPRNYWLGSTLPFVQKFTMSPRRSFTHRKFARCLPRLKNATASRALPQSMCSRTSTRGLMKSFMRSKIIGIELKYLRGIQSEIDRLERYMEGHTRVFSSPCSSCSRVGLIKNASDFAAMLADVVSCVPSYFCPWGADFARKCPIVEIDAERDAWHVLSQSQHAIAERRAEINDTWPRWKGGL